MSATVISNIRHAWPEGNGFIIDRPHGIDSYVFIHLWKPVTMTLGEKTFRTEPSACVFFNIDTYQKWSNDSDGFIHDWIHINGDVGEALGKAGLEFDHVYYPAGASFITEIVRGLETEFNAAKIHSTELCDLQLREMMYLIARASATDAVRMTADTETINRFRRLRSEIFSDLTNNRSTSELAKEMQVSESRFYVLYREIFGISPTKDIINARIETAKTYILSGNYSVKEVAALVGYANQFHFIRQFCDITGTTPGKYRESISSNGK